MILTLEKSGPIAIARLSGEWRGTDGQETLDALHPTVAETGAKLILDLGGLTMIDSSGLAALISVVTHARLCHARVVLAAPNAFVSGVFEVTRLDRWFEVAESVAAATAQLSGS
jgi:anti-sigma B factor antagonist